MKKDSKWMSRKFITMIALELLTTVLLFLGKVEAGNWVTMTQWIFLTYAASNAASKIVSKKATQ